eukprot:jgi/Mesvir1/7830/Mv11771-RA.1
MAKVIAVFGATGGQGGSVAQVLLKDPSFEVRALTRSVTSAKAKELEALGAKPAAADMDDVASLTAALQGAYGAFFVTNFWEHMDAEREIQQIKNLASAAKACNLSHVVNSTLEDTRPHMRQFDDCPDIGPYKVPHFDAKGSMQNIVADSVPTTHLLLPFFMDNFLTMLKPAKGPDGQLAVSLPFPPNAKLAMIAREDIGRAVAAIFRKPELVGKTVGISSEQLTGPQIASIFSRVTGASITYVCIPYDVYAKLPFPGADDLANMFMFYDRCEEMFCKARDPAATAELAGGPLTSLEEYLTQHKSVFDFQ